MVDNYPMISLKHGIKVSLVGTAIEAVGIILDVLHHLQIGIETPEGLVTGNHLTIFAGFFINFIGVVITLISSRKNN